MLFLLRQTMAGFGRLCVCTSLRQTQGCSQRPHDVYQQNGLVGFYALLQPTLTTDSGNSHCLNNGECGQVAEDNCPRRFQVDGLTLYRALARVVYGDPARYGLVLRGVVDHFLRVWIKPNHPLCGRYRHLERELFYLFPVLCDPNIAPWADEADDADAFTDRRETQRAIYEIIANALGTCLVVLWTHEYRPERGPIPRAFTPTTTPTQPTTVFWEGGPVQFPIYRVALQDVDDFYTSIIEDESEKVLIDFLRTEKNRNGQNGPVRIQEVRWHWEDFNYENRKRLAHTDDGYRNERNIKYSLMREGTILDWVPNHHGGFALIRKLDSNCVFTVMIRDSHQIQAALDLLDAAMARAPAQAVPVLTGNGIKAQLKPYYALDAEFLFREASFVPNHADKTQQRRLNAGRRERLCSLLNVAVDRHLFVSFHLLAMLDNADQPTVGNMEKLWRRFLFNPDIIKLWYNWQTDLVAIDATIAQMYQGTPREMTIVLRNTGTVVEVQPLFKLPNWFFGGERPADLYLIQRESHDSCPFHRFLVTTNDGPSLLARLSNVHENRGGERAEYYSERRWVDQRLSALTHRSGTPLIEDIPRGWGERSIFDRRKPKRLADRKGTLLEDYWLPDMTGEDWPAEEPGLWKPFPSDVLERPLAHSWGEHEQIYEVLAAEEMDEAYFPAIEQWSDDERRRGSYKLHAKLFDPCKFHLPEGLCTMTAVESLWRDIYTIEVEDRKSNRGRREETGNEPGLEK